MDEMIHPPVEARQVDEPPPTGVSVPSGRRFFNASEKATLRVLADGKCQMCGQALGAGFHADHLTPYSAGGETDVTNAAALCPTCNLRKGARSLAERADLRQWQRTALATYLASKPTDYLAVATPGAGKTTFALAVARQLLDERLIRRVIVVVPSKHLCHQWHKAAHSVGVNIDPDMDKRYGITADFHGASVTYHGVAHESMAYRYLSGGEGDALVILDEVHHCGDSKDWGDKIRHAFERAKYRLCLSGTPFRSDNSTIPFVKYVDGKSVADFRYDYAAALRDGVCRPVIFPHYDSDVEWMSGMQVCRSRFTEALSDERRAERLRAALRSGEFLPGMLREANDKLQEVRDNGDARAGGLVLAMRQDDAADIARMISDISDEPAVLAVSDDKDAHNKIKEFGNSRQRWLVAVNMVSEGVDIPRLRVGVYATNIVTELFFRQAVGRLVRVNPELEDQVAYMFLPQDEAILTHARTIKEERSHWVDDDVFDGHVDRTERTGDNGQPALFAALGSTAPEHVGSIYDESDYSAADIERARAGCAELGIVADPEKIIQLFRMWGVEPTAAPRHDVRQTAPASKTNAEIRKELSNLNQGLAIKLSQRTGVHYSDIHATANGATGCPSPKKATIEQLQRKQEWLKKELLAVASVS